MPGRRLFHSISIVIAASLATACLAADARAELLAELQRIADSSGGQMGVSALLMKTGERVQLHAAERYPMASTLKVAVAVKVLDEVDHGRLSLNEKVEIPSGELSPGSGEISRDMDPGAPAMGATVRELLEAMMIMSDNTATDRLMALVGGPAAVTRHMRVLGVADIDINRPTANIIADSWGFKLPRAGERTRQNLRDALAKTPPARREEAARRFLADARDTTTPDAMVAILERLASGAALGKESTALLLDIMSRCKTGPRRLKGELPKGIAVAHKTGTLTRVATNDVGFISLAFGSGPLVVAVYVRGSTLPIQAQERAIAAAALALYRYYK